MKVIFFENDMKGDIFIIDDNHRKAAGKIVELLLDEILKFDGKFAISVAGESGAGKSEVAASIAEKLKEYQITSFIFGQDDYFKLPPKTNARQREKDIFWVGLQEVRLDSLDQNILEAMKGESIIVKPLVDFNADNIGIEKVHLKDCKVLIAEGTYTSKLNHVNCRVFIDRNKMDTLESRKKRAREKQDEFLERILTIEHEIISKHKTMADIVISKEWNVSRVK
jgi:uridine kinase